MADVAGVVEEGAAPFDRVEVLRKRLEVVPRDAGEERVGRHVLDVLQRADEELAVLGTDRCDREPAVAGDDTRDPVPTGRTERGIPEHLGVVVRVDVDEARCDDVPGRIERPPAVEVVANLGDDAAADGDVGAATRRAGSVDDRAAFDDDVRAHAHLRTDRHVSLARDGS